MPARVITSGKMTLSEYMAIHYWVESQLGKPRECKKCGDTSDQKRYDWANVSCEYKKDLSDWERLCRKCHNIKDRGQFCRRGHPLTEDNVYNHPSGGGRICRICKRAIAKKWQEIYKERRRLLK